MNRKEIGDGQDWRLWKGGHLKLSYRDGIVLYGAGMVRR